VGSVTSAATGEGAQCKERESDRIHTCAASPQDIKKKIRNGHAQISTCLDEVVRAGGDESHVRKLDLAARTHSPVCQP